MGIVIQSEDMRERESKREREMYTKIREMVRERTNRQIWVKMRHRLIQTDTYR